MRLSSDEKCLLFCCVLCVRCSFWAFWPRNSVVPMILCAVTCTADTMIALARLRTYSLVADYSRGPEWPVLSALLA